MKMSGDATTLKAQPTIRGYNAFVVNNLVSSKGITTSEVVAWIVDRWIDDNRKFLNEEFGITRGQFTASQPTTKVVGIQTGRGAESPVKG
jgi:hypothetical protein